jgi:predicted outer membrane repeat protein
LGLLAPQQAARAEGVLFVKPGGSGDCGSWESACSLASALGSAAVGDEIWVAEGLHLPTSSADRTIAFQLRSGVAVYGGFVGSETQRSQRDPQAHLTVLSGDIDRNDSQSPVITDLTTVTGAGANSYHVVRGATGATLDGFTITAGNANGAADPDWHGGGMYNLISSPTLANLTFSGNAALKLGGGMYNDDSRPSLSQVTFSHNHAQTGGGMYNTYSDPTLLGATFSGNTAELGGGMGNSYSAPTLSGVTFNSNSASDGGGAMYNWGSAPTVLTTLFSSNTAYDRGGAIYNFYYSNPTFIDVAFHYNSATYTTSNGGAMYISESSPSFKNVTFKGNWALNHGGAIYWSYAGNGIPTLTNVTFSGNQATKNGGGMYAFFNAGNNPVMKHLTLSNNSALYGGGIYIKCFNAQIRNSILWGNTAITDGAQIYNNASTLLTLSDSVVQGGCPAGSTCTNILTTDPNLSSLGDHGGFTQTFALRLPSSAVDSGNDATSAPSDQRGVTRPQGAHVDMGAVERDSTPPLVVSITRSDPSPTNQALVHFTVTFSEAVTGVDTGDFSLAMDGVSGALVSQVSGSGSVYSVSVSTGTGTGTLRLDLIDNGTILDLDFNPLGASFTQSDVYAIRYLGIFLPLVRRG